jgi:hypothetical protein
MCNCLVELEERIEKYFADPAKNKVVEGVALEGVGRFFNKSTMQLSGRKTITEFKVVFTKGKPVKSQVVHTFCPFCGVAYGAEKEVQL